ncbi:serine hydrolase [Sphaerisporangium perillae]|uniref:serine hydrolase n=1 Tax=Sphaerisporangium perillae TaxID=2935860 RepID=UPI00200F85B2|nr:serine hydrolase [Sphaerisporangium perillae]
MGDSAVMDLEPVAGGCPGTLAVSVPGLLALNEDVELPLASAGKLLLLAEVARSVSAGSLDPAETVTLLDDDYCGGSGLLGGLSARRWTIGDLALLTAAVSDNTATNALIRRLGLDRVNERAADLGFVRTRVLDRIREPRLPEHPATFAVGTAAELARFAADLVDAADPAPWKRKLIGWMAHNTDRSLVPALLPHEPEDRDLPAGPVPSGTVWAANKTGTDTGVRTDVGVLIGVRRVGYAVLTLGLAGQEPALVTAVRQAGIRIGALALRRT